MSDGGAIVNYITARVDGQDQKVLVVVSHDSVTIGGAAFKRHELLFALDVKEPQDA